MIPKASRKERANMTAPSSGDSKVVYTVSSNRTFILTDLVFTYSDPGAGIRVYDSTTEASAPTAATAKIRFHGNPVVMTDIQNGPEFERGVNVLMDDPNHAMPLQAVWIGGFER